MPSRKTLVVFFLLVAVFYGVFLVPWPGVMTAYRQTVAAISNVFLGSIGDGRMKFELMDAPTLDKDTTVEVKNVATGSKARMSVNARRTYLPVSFAVALILAAPVPWQRKLIALGLGLALMAAYVQFGIWLKLVHMLSEPKFGAMELGETTRKFLMVLIRVLTLSPVVPYIVALVVFVLVTVRREDLVRLGTGSNKPKTAVAER